MEGRISQQDGSTRWRFLETNRAVLSPNWLPPAADVPELADLRDEHARLRALQTDAMAELVALQARRDQEEEARRAAQESEFLGRAPAGELPPITVGDEELLDAKVRADAAKDALQTFVKGAIAQVRERQSVLVEGLAATRAKAEQKRREAEALMNEAQLLHASTVHLATWLARTVGSDPLGFITWTSLPDAAQIVAAERQREANTEAALGAMVGGNLVGGVVELDSPHGPSFGTDDPDNLDNDSAAATPWEVAIHD